VLFSILYSRSDTKAADISKMLPHEIKWHQRNSNLFESEF